MGELRRRTAETKPTNNNTMLEIAAADYAPKSEQLQIIISPRHQKHEIQGRETSSLAVAQPPLNAGCPRNSIPHRCTRRSAAIVGAVDEAGPDLT